MLADNGTLVSQAIDSGGMLGPEDLRSIDRTIVSYLAEGRVTPAYARMRLVEEGGDEYSRGYVQQRLARLEEHQHVVNLLGTGLYELRDDPRDD